ncbi:PKD domain-containing protein [Aeromicrobium sp. UC242_57]|uniref:PKD domain-containing protein n=1 Tax=Aeromicrobium sp. UC242_57 TaxID=3374624 RepID=UPI0037B512C1
MDAELVGDVTFSEATFADSSPRVLDKPAFGDDSGTAYPYYKNASPSVYALSNGKIGYFRPMTDKNDVNGPDLFTATGRIDLTIHTTGSCLEPTATVSNSAPTTKEAPKFSVDPNGDKGMDFEYRWEFGDDRGPGRGDKSPSHRYLKKGEYDAYVTVRGADGSYGRSAVLPIKVAKPPPKPKPTTSTGGGTGGGVTGGTGGYVPPYTPPTTDFPEPDPIEEPFDDEPTEDVPVDDGLVDVEGYVLAGAEIVPGGTPEAIPGTQASADPTPASTTSVRKRLATWTVAAFAIVLLVGAGAASETRWFRNRLRHLRRRA